MNNILLEAAAPSRPPPVSPPSGTQCASEFEQIPLSGTIIGILLCVITFATAIPQHVQLCRSADGVSLATYVFTVALLALNIGASVITKWHQIQACGSIGWICVPPLLDLLQLLSLATVICVQLVQLVCLPPFSHARFRLFAAAALFMAFGVCLACVLLSLVAPCSRGALDLSQVLAAIGGCVAALQYLPQLRATILHGGSGNLSITFYFTQVLGGVIVFVDQAFVSHDPWPVWGPMSVSTTVQGIVTVSCLYFDGRKWLHRRRRQRALETGLLQHPQGGVGGATSGST